MQGLGVAQNDYEFLFEAQEESGQGSIRVRCCKAILFLVSYLEYVAVQMLLS